jgi:acyl-CoA reductase-like NAD-dependent aldehyde dehydrogenase
VTAPTAFHQDPDLSAQLNTVESIDRITPSSKAEMDQALEVLHAAKDKWISLELEHKIQVLDQLLQDFNHVAKEWVDLSMQGKGIPKKTFGEGEEWFNIAISNRLVRLYRKSLEEIIQQGKPSIPGPITENPNGQLSVQVFPQKTIDRLLLLGTTCQVIMPPGMTREDLLENQASAYLRGDPTGKITLVLGAGNTSFLIPGDILAKLFGDGQVVIFKPNPLNEFLGPLVEYAFRSLIEPGYMRVVYGGAEQGAYLSHHDLDDELHMTGSHHTFEAIVFGPGEEGSQRKAARTPQLKKRFTAELGNITPVIVVPGDWSESEIQTQGIKIATWLVYNAGFACPAPRLVIQSKNWPLRDQLNQAIKEAFSRVETRHAFYPGSEKLHADFVAAHPGSTLVGDPPQGHLPWTYLTDVDPADVDNICFKEEQFCSILSETALEVDSVSEFIGKAVSFVNQHVWGTLHAILIVDPKTARDPEIAAAVEQAIADLRYGTVAVNQHPAISYYIGLTTWGGFPGHDIYDIQSGTGVVNNTLMLSNPEKSVMRAPFNLSPDPFVLSTLRAHEFGAKMAAYEAEPSLRKLPSILWTVLRGPHQHVFENEWSLFPYE